MTPDRIAKASAVLAMASMLGGCPPPFYGILREFRITSMPDSQCIQDSITAMPGATGVIYREYDGGKDLVGTSIPTTQNFLYQKAGWKKAAVVLQVTKYEKEIWVSHYQLNSTVDKPEETPAEVKQFMLSVEDGLSKQCGLGMVAETLKEQCKNCTLPK